MFFTTIVKKENLESKKTIEKDVKKDETQNENILENYYKMGTYCSAEIDPKYPNTIVFFINFLIIYIKYLGFTRYS